MHCFRCDYEMSPVFGQNDSDEVVLPGDGLVFSARGNYGSTVFDPPGDTRSLLIYVCDACVVERKSVVRAVHTNTKTTHKVETWEPEAWDDTDDGL